MLRVSLHSLLAHKLRLALTAIAVILGVTFVSGTLILTETIQATFHDVYADATKGVAVIVGGPENAAGTHALPVSTSLLAPVRSVPGVKDADGVLSRAGIAILRDGQVISAPEAPTIGGDWIPDADLSPYRLRSGSPPQGPGDVVVDAAFAARQHVGVGDTVDISFAAGMAQPFRVSGITGYGGESSAAGAGLALFTTAEAEQVLQAGGMFDDIYVGAQGTGDDTQLRDRIASALSRDDVTVETGQQASAAAEQSAEKTINEFLGTPLLAFAFIAVFVGTFLIVNTFNILVAQRTQELALLRALGATRRQVLVEVLTEAAVTGVVASILGFLLGILVAAGLVSLFDASAKLTIEARSLVVSLLVGTIVTVLAATLPARRATRIAPVAALREALPEIQGLPRKRIGAGLALLVAGTAALLFSLFSATETAPPNLELLGAGALGMFLGVALLAPALVRPVVAVLGWPARHLRGAPGRLAGENAQRNPRRTALTSAALMIGLALVTCVAVLTDSVLASTADAIEGSLRAGLVVLDRQTFGAFSTQAAATLRTDPRLTDIAEIRHASVLIGNVSQGVVAIDPALAPKVFGLQMTSGAASSIAASGTVLVDSSEAAGDHLRVGSRVTMTFSQGDRITVSVGGIFQPDALVNGYITSLATIAPYVTTPRDILILANPAPGVSLDAAQQSMERDLHSYPLLSGFTKDGYLALIETGLNSFLNLIYVLLGLAILIAVLGILNTLALSVLERTRELGLLRALGMTRGQTEEMVGWESVIIALLGAVLGLGVGTGLGIALVSGFHNLGIDVTAVPVGNLALYAAAAAVFGVLAAVFPAVKASRVDVLRAVTTE
ncbi:MAG: FtsX-like permease family protein [Candidatus Dormibacteria bacterium]